MKISDLKGKTIKRISKDIPQTIEILFTDGTQAIFEADTDHDNLMIEVSIEHGWNPK